MPKFTQVRADAFESIQINAGVLLSAFDPSAGTFSKQNIIGTTTGGVSFNSNLETVDFGEDVDNVPSNTWQLKKVTQFSPTVSGTFVTVDSTLGKRLVTAATVSNGHIIPKNLLEESDFEDIWLVGDYSDKNGAANGGFVAIHIKHAFSTGGFQWQTTKNGKGQFAFEFTGHYDMDDVDDPPFEIYIKAGTADPVWSIHGPEDKSATAGTSTSFTVSVYYDDDPTIVITGLTYQWQREVGAAPWTDIEGETSSTISIGNVTSGMNGNKYRVKVTDNVGLTKYSSAATLTVTAGA